MAKRSQPQLEALRTTYLAIVAIAASIRADMRFAQPDGASAEESVAWREQGEACTSLASLRQLMRDALTEWNEGAGAAVEEFWRLVAERGLDVPRTRDIVVETLRRGRVLNPPQFHALEDHFEDLQTCGKLNADEASALDRILNAFDAEPKNFNWTARG